MPGSMQLHARRMAWIAAFVLAAFLFDVRFCGAVQASNATHNSAEAAASFKELAAQATAAREAGRLQEALALFRRALAQNPRWAEGWWSLGTLYYDNEQYGPAANAFRRVVSLEPKHGTARAMLGLSEFEIGQGANALEDIEASKSLGIEEDPQLRQVVLYHEGVLFQRAGKFEAAQKALSTLCLSGVRNEELARTFGLDALHMRDTNQPEAGTAKADVVEHVGRGACLSAAKEYDAARREYQFAIDHYPHFPLVHFACGKFLLAARDRAGAIHEFQQEIAEAPDAVLARMQIAATEYKVDSAAGLPYAEEAVRLAPQAPAAHYLFGLLLLDIGDYSKAISHLEIAEKAFPKETKIYWSLGVAYAHAGREQDAARARTEFAQMSQAAGPKAENAPDGQDGDADSQIEITDGMAPAVGR